MQDANEAMEEMEKSGYEIVKVMLFNYTAMERSELTGETLPRPIPIFFVVSNRKVFTK